MHILKQSGVLANDDLLGLLSDNGILEVEAQQAITALVRFNIIMPVITHRENMTLSLWGQYFFENIALDLPYITTIWWTTLMLPEFGLGVPREMRPSELRDYAGRFVRWLQREEHLASSRIGDHLRASLAGWSICADVASSVMWSLRRIEESIFRGAK